ncbi:MAG: phage head-tail joining protein [Rhodoplanes sp.]
MATAEEITARIEQLEKLKATGFARVSYEGRTVEYRSLAEIERAIASLRDQLAAADPPPRRVVYAYQRRKAL